jgi:hypothetical protein
MKIYIPSRHNSIFEGFEEYFEIVDKIDDSEAVLLWNDVNSFERSVIDLSRSLGKKVVTLQHGRRGTSKYYPPFNEKIQSDALLVWGEFDKRSLVDANQDAQKIRVIGTSILQDLPKREGHEGINIVFCPEHWDKEVEENFKTRDALRDLQSNHGVNVITKIIESHDPKDYDNPIQTNRNDSEHLRTCKELLSKTDLVVGISESTFELIAQAMDIPVVIMSEWKPKPCNGDERYKTYRRVVSKGSCKSNLKDLEKDIIFHLENPDDLQDERREVVIGEGGLGLDTINLIKKAL